MNGKMQILTMVKEGKITVEEGMRLLNALEDINTSDSPIVSGNKVKWLRVRVFDPEDNVKVNVTLPTLLINVGIKLASKFSPEFREAGLTEESVEEILAAIKNGTTGKIVDMMRRMVPRSRLF